MWKSTWPLQVYTLPDGARVVPLDEELAFVVPADVPLTDGLEEFICALVEAAIARP
jgi:hypothetical protein